MKRRERSQTEQLRQALADREARLQEAQARLAALEGSASLQVGRALTAAAKSPKRGIVRLPRDLYRAWRGSTHPRNRRGAEPVRSYAMERHESRLLSGLAGARDELLVVAGVLSAEARAAIEPYVHVVPLRPHDAQLVIDSVDVDLVLVTASAAAPGTLWAHVGDPAVADRTRTLGWILEAASAHSVPSVLVQDAPAPPALASIGFSHVHRGDLGVALHMFNSVATEPERDATPVHPATKAAPRGPASAMITALHNRSELRRGDVLWRDQPTLLRGAAAAVVTDPAMAAKALACGARTVRVGGRGVSDFPDGVLRTAAAGAGAESEMAEAVDALARVRAAGALTPDEQRLVLRTVFLRHATPVKLADVVSRVGLAPGTAGHPTAGRRVALLAYPVDDTSSLALADDVRNQLHPPAEVVVPQDAERFAGVGRLVAHGVPVRTVQTGEDPNRFADPAPGPGPLVWAKLAEAAESPWAAMWTHSVGTAFLADLLCAAECSGADAVGPALAPWGEDPDDLADADQDYVFVSAIRPSLARRALVARGLHPGIWGRHGARLLALAAAPAASRRTLDTA